MSAQTQSSHTAAEQGSDKLLQAILEMQSMLTSMDGKITNLGDRISNIETFQSSLCKNSWRKPRQIPF